MHRARQIGAIRRALCPVWLIHYTRKHIICGAYVQADRQSGRVPATVDAGTKMANVKTQGIHRPPVLRWLVFQTFMVVLIALAFWVRGNVAAYSALVGGFIFVLPNAYFARKAFRHAGARSAKQIVSSFYQGEAGKLILSAVFFTMAFKWIQPLDVAALFLTFAIMLVINWLTPLLASGRPQRR